MVAVLVDSRSEGQTGLVATRGLQRVKVEGMAGCLVELDCGVKLMQIRDDGEYELPAGVEFVQAFHRETTADSRVFVDLVR